MATMTEREFLISLAVNKFNQQFGRTFVISDFDIFSITPTYSTAKGYEIYTVRFDDYVRLRIYFNFGTVDRLGPYKLETDVTHSVGALDDEVFVSLGEVNRYYLDSGMYRFRWINQDITRYNILLTESSEALITEDSEYILLEEGD